MFDGESIINADRDVNLKIYKTPAQYCENRGLAIMILYVLNAFLVMLVIADVIDHHVPVVELVVLLPEHQFWMDI